MTVNFNQYNSTLNSNSAMTLGLGVQPP